MYVDVQHRSLQVKTTQRGMLNLHGQQSSRMQCNQGSVSTSCYWAPSGVSMVDSGQDPKTLQDYSDPLGDLDKGRVEYPEGRSLPGVRSTAKLHPSTLRNNLNIASWEGTQSTWRQQKKTEEQDIFSKISLLNLLWLWLTFWEGR